MLMNPEWGVPGVLYTDNGAEMAGLDEILSELSLVDKAPVIRAAAYTPQAKPIEAIFSAFNRVVFPKIVGFTGGKARKRPGRIGSRKAVVYDKSWAEFSTAFEQHLADYNSTGRGKSAAPLSRYRKKMRQHGFKHQVLERIDILPYVSTPVSRRLNQGSVMLRGTRHTTPRFYELVGDERIECLVPPLGAASPYAVFDDQIVELDVDSPFDGLDPAGAVAAAERRQAHLQAAARKYQALGGRRAHPADQISLANQYVRSRRRAASVVAEFERRPPSLMTDIQAARTLVEDEIRRLGRS